MMGWLGSTLAPTEPDGEALLHHLSGNGITVREMHMLMGPFRARTQ